MLDYLIAEQRGTPLPLALLERIIKASSNPGDLVLDPFCGCATTLVAAELLEREWAGIDLSPLAVKLVEQRLRDTPNIGFIGEPVARTDVPHRTDVDELPDYRTHRHTLYGVQEGHCNGCRVHFPFRNLTVDHVVARKKGGQDNPENLQLLCGACNSKKGHRLPGGAGGQTQAGGIEVTDLQWVPAKWRKGVMATVALVAGLWFLHQMWWDVYERGYTAGRRDAVAEEVWRAPVEEWKESSSPAGPPPVVIDQGDWRQAIAYEADMGGHRIAVVVWCADRKVTVGSILYRDEGAELPKATEFEVPEGFYVATCGGVVTR